MRGALFATTCASVVLLVACSEILGIGELPLPSGDAATSDAVAPDGVAPDSSAGLCSMASEVMTSSTVGIDSLASSGGFVFGNIVFASGEGIARCAINADCKDSFPSVVTSPSPALIAGLAVDTSIHYTIGGNGENTGSVHVAGLDGSGDLPIEGSLADPSWIAMSGTKTFWVDDPIGANDGTTPAIVHCLGCGGSDVPWITNLGQTYALVADANAVYVVADDPANAGSAGVFRCATTAACGAAGAAIVTNLDPQAISNANLASDGTFLYVANPDDGSLEKYTASGASTQLGNTTTGFSAIAIDASSGDLFYGTSFGVVGRMKSDGTNASSLSKCTKPVVGIAFDAANVYANAALMATETNVYAIAR